MTMPNLLYSKPPFVSQSPPGTRESQHTPPKGRRRQVGDEKGRGVGSLVSSSISACPQD